MACFGFDKKSKNRPNTSRRRSEPSRRGQTRGCRLARRLDPFQDFVVNCVGLRQSNLDGYRRQSCAEGKNPSGDGCRGGVGSLLFTSSISVYPQSEGISVDEKSSTEGASERGRLLLRRKKMPRSVSRRRPELCPQVGGLYGPGRHLMVEKLKAGQAFEGNGLFLEP